MKIRIKGNSIRYRLTKTEVETFCATGYFEETTDFGAKLFTYALKAQAGVDILDAEFQGDKITLFLDSAKSNIWYQSNLVGFKHSVTKKNGGELSLLLEKDFVCMDETIEDQSDNYPNPNLDS